jgi:hypothetical protein
MNVPNNNRQNPMSQNPQTARSAPDSSAPDHELDPQRESDRQVDEALASFGLAMRAWGDHELAHRPAAPLREPIRKPRAQSWLLAPALGWAAAAALAIAAIGVPLGIHHHNAVVANHPYAVQPQPAPQPAQIASSKADDDQLLEHVDTDIAQDAPDAMQPLASLMSSSGAE